MFETDEQAALASTVPALRQAQDVFAPASDQAAAIAGLTNAMIAAFAIVFALVMLALLYAVLRARRRHGFGDAAATRLVWIGGAAIPLLVLVALVVLSVEVGSRTMSSPPAGALTIEVIGRQWWWQLRYHDEHGRVLFESANEIHVPVGQPVRFLLRSTDVIHSFWLPNLQGKLDMIPGRTNISWFEADRAGVYRGQCAEFCGRQHALMAFELVAEPIESFERWQRVQQQPASAADHPGLPVFVDHGCGECHTIRGTAADGEIGPDLTHLASRRTLAAATLPNSKGHLGGWISDPQGNKPGNRMPPTLLEVREHRLLLDYLQRLE